MLTILSMIIQYTLGTLVVNILSIIPYKIYSYLIIIIRDIYSLLFAGLGFFVILHLFNVRYVDYVLEKENNKTINDDKIKLKKEKKIVVRDENETTNKLFNFIVEIIIIFFKLLLLPVILALALLTVMTVVMFVLSFNVFKTGMLFIGLILGFGVLSFFLGYTIYILINFIFKKEINLKPYIISIVTSIILGAIAVGLVFTSTLKFEYHEDKYFEETIYKYKMEDNLRIYSNYPDIEYIEEDRKNIKVVVTKWEIMELEEKIDERNNVFYLNTTNPLKFANEMLKIINKKEIIPFDTVKVKVYGKKTNLDRLRNYD